LKRQKGNKGIQISEKWGNRVDEGFHTREKSLRKKEKSKRKELGEPSQKGKTLL